MKTFGSETTEQVVKFSEYRDGAKPDGEPLTARYLERSHRWRLKGSTLSRNKERLRRIDAKGLGTELRGYVYHYGDLMRLRGQMDLRDDTRDT